MANWSTLSDAYGNATDVPNLIDDWVLEPTEDKLSDLWSRLCHQGTVYSASFAAIPVLYRALPTLRPIDRRNAIMLVGAILASTDRHRGAAPDETVFELLPALRDVAAESLADADIDEAEFPYVLQALAALRGDPLWGRVFADLVGGEFNGVCPRCECALLLVIGDEGFFASVDDYVRNADATRIPIAPAPSNSLSPVGAWLHQQALNHSHTKTATGVAYMFGSTACPACDAAIAVEGAIAKATRRSE